MSALGYKTRWVRLPLLMCSLILPSHVGIGLQDALGKLFFFPIFPFFEAFLLFIFLFFPPKTSCRRWATRRDGKAFLLFHLFLLFPQPPHVGIGLHDGMGKSFSSFTFFFFIFSNTSCRCWATRRHGQALLKRLLCNGFISKYTREFSFESLCQLL